MIQLLHENDLENGDIKESFFKYNVFVRDCWEAFRENLAQGYYDAEEQEERVANLDQDDRDFDEWKEKEFEENWGDLLNQTIIVSENMTLLELCMCKVIKKGDEFVYSYESVGKRKTVTVYTSLKVVNIDGSASLTVQFIKNESKEIEKVTEIEQLMRTFEQLTQKQLQNAWSEISLKRTGYILGNLETIRKDYFDKTMGNQLKDANKSL